MPSYWLLNSIVCFHVVDALFIVVLGPLSRFKARYSSCRSEIRLT